MWTKPCVDISVSGMSQVLFVQDLTKRPALGVNLKMLRTARLFPYPLNIVCLLVRLVRFREIEVKLLWDGLVAVFA